MTWRSDRHDRVVELGLWSGGFSRRILRRLGEGGVLVGVDSSEGLLSQAKTYLAELVKARFEPVQPTSPNSVPGSMCRCGLRTHDAPPCANGGVSPGPAPHRLASGHTCRFLEPDFRSPLGRIGFLEAPADQSWRPCASGPRRSTSSTRLTAFFAGRWSFLGSNTANADTWAMCPGNAAVSAEPRKLNVRRDAVAW